LVHFLRLLVIAEHVGGQRQGELYRPPAGIPPFQTGVMWMSA
jgi:hypothetical protein